MERVDIMHAGREVRVVIETEERGEIDPASQTASSKHISDGDLIPLAQDIARALEREMSISGQIRVTVIHESRLVAIAH